jgi:hypothetical protein
MTRREAEPNHTPQPNSIIELEHNVHHHLDAKYDPPTDRPWVIVRWGEIGCAIPWNQSTPLRQQCDRIALVKPWGRIPVEIRTTRYLLEIQLGQKRMTIVRSAPTNETIYYIIPETENEYEFEQVIIQRGETRLVLQWDLSVPVCGATLLAPFGQIPVKLNQNFYRFMLQWDQTRLEIQRFAPAF